MVSLRSCPFLSNVNGTPDGSVGNGIAWASLGSTINKNGELLAPGYAFDVAAGGYVGMSFNAQTYPGLKALVDHNFDVFREFLYDRNPTWRSQGLLDSGIEPLKDLDPLYYALFTTPGLVLPEPDLALFVPFQFNVMASATPMTRDEFVARQTADAEKLRQAVLKDTEATPALQVLASDKAAWTNGYLGALEQAGLLRPVDQAPPVRLDPKVVSLMGTLGMGLLIGPAGDQVRTTSDLVAFFGKIHEWYGDTPGVAAPLRGYDHRETETDAYDVPIPALPQFADYDLGLSHQTYFQTFNVFSPFLGGDVTALPDFGSDATTGNLSPLDLGRFLQEVAAAGQAAAMIGPQGYGDQQFLPAGQALPYQVRFQNPSSASGTVSEVRIVTQLDSDLDPQSLRLGDLKIGDITVHLPEGAATFQGDFDFISSKGFVLRISAGIDVASSTATWLLQAIDPETGEVVQDAGEGLLPPNNAQGAGAGYVTYTVQTKAGAASGATISAKARVLFNTMAPQDTDEISQTLDSTAPTTQLTVKPIGQTNYDLNWKATNDSAAFRRAPRHCLRRDRWRRLQDLAIADHRHPRHLPGRGRALLPVPRSRDRQCGQQREAARQRHRAVGWLRGQSWRIAERRLD